MNTFHARWEPDGSLTQIISGSAGATPDDKSKNPLVKSKYPIFAAWDYIFTVVDVHGDFVTAQTYAVRPQPSPTYTMKVDPLDVNGTFLLLLAP